MHVLVTTDTLSGVWTYTRELVTGLVGRGNRVTLVSFGEIPWPEQTTWMNSLPGLDYRPTAFSLDWMQKGVDDFKDSSAYLLEVISEAKPDLLHLNHPCYGALRANIPRVVVAHGDLINWWKAVHGRSPDDSAWLRWYHKTVTEGVSRADAVVAPTVWMLDAIRSSYMWPKRASVIYSGRSPIFFNPYVKKEDAVLSVGRLWDPGKQLCLLTGHPHPVPVSIVASDATISVPKIPIRADVRFATTRTSVALKGQQTDIQLRSLYSRSSIYVAPSRYEPFAMATVEAALSRCAIIANDIPSFREIWGNAALYFQENDGVSLAKLIHKVSADREMCTTYANRAFQRAHECFTSKRMVDDYTRLYARLVPAQDESLAA